ncbi:hypothetical protein R3P38DRAFT_1308978 [Favolaschia claudopus]|uniref:Uncharacterized protein n=1 Tax=Favolaschia claudopus TaxID=2862362 RepID=A0AAW0AXZ0_9AGAR
MSTTLPASWHQYLSRSELNYRAVTDYLKESYQAYPFATTTLVLFVVTSFVPVTTLLALTAFALCAILAGSLSVLIGAVLGLVVVLSTTLLSSVIAGLLAAGVLGIRDQVLVHSEGPNVNTDSIIHNPTRRLATVMRMVNHNISSTLQFLNRRHWTIRVLSVVLAVDFIARTLLGADILHPIPSYPLVRPIFAVPWFIVHRINVGDLTFVLKVLTKPFPLFGWKVFIIVCPLYGTIILAPLHGVIVRLAILLSRSALRVMGSESLNLKKLYHSQLAVHGPTARAFLHNILAAIIAFLQKELANIDAAHGRTENNVQSSISESVVISSLS